MNHRHNIKNYIRTCDKLHLFSSRMPTCFSNSFIIASIRRSIKLKQESPHFSVSSMRSSTNAPSSFRIAISFVAFEIAINLYRDSIVMVCHLPVLSKSFGFGFNVVKDPKPMLQIFGTHTIVIAVPLKKGFLRKVYIVVK